MVAIAVQIDKLLQAAKSKECKYLVFIFLERDSILELEVVGWMQFQEQVAKPGGIMGVIHLNGYGVPVIRRSNNTGMTETTCIIIFEYAKPYKYYCGIAVDGIENVMNIAEKDPETTAVIETEVEYQLGGRQVQYSIIEK